MKPKAGTLGQEILVLQEISSAVVHKRNVDALLNEILAVLHRRMGMLRGTITLLHGDTLAIEASHGLDDEEKQLGRYHLGEGITAHVAETGRPHLVPHISRDPRFLNRTGSRKTDHPIAFLCVPIFHMEQVIGTLSIDRENVEGTDLERDLALLEIIGNIVADAVAVCLKEHEERENLLEENRKLRNMLTGNPGKLVGNCRCMQNIYELIRQVAPSDATVLIRGSSGTGKELVARAIVELSSRKDKPFVTLNCAALPENLVESELFGHERGAFTSAIKQRRGKFEQADGGTLFMDEIGDMSLAAQAKVLRALQENRISRVGSDKDIEVNVRVIAATNKNLREEIRKGNFREDLYHRIGVVVVRVPALREHAQDIPLLVDHFIHTICAEYHIPAKRIEEEALSELQTMPWSGNIRELRNVIERLIILSEERITPADVKAYC